MFFVISNQFGSFGGEFIERIVNERVEDSHSFFGDSDFGVYLFQNFVNVDSERFNSFFGSFDNLFFNDFCSGCGFLGGHFNI